RATFRKTLPSFSVSAITNNLNLTDGTWVDACAYGTGILRVANVGNYLYTQYIPDLHATWPNWVNTTHPLLLGSRPALDNGNVWFQSANASIYYYAYPDAMSYTLVRAMSAACALAPLNNRCYALWQRNAGSYEIMSLNGQESSQYTIYGLTSMPRVDAVS